MSISNTRASPYSVGSQKDRPYEVFLYFNPGHASKYLFCMLSTGRVKS